jgi:hypothetical protein
MEISHDIKHDKLRRSKLNFLFDKSSQNLNRRKPPKRCRLIINHQLIIRMQKFLILSIFHKINQFKILNLIEIKLSIKSTLDNRYSN